MHLAKNQDGYQSAVIFLLIFIAILVLFMGYLIYTAPKKIATTSGTSTIPAGTETAVSGVNWPNYNNDKTVLQQDVDQAISQATTFIKLVK